jgi:hypothetical protein
MKGKMWEYLYFEISSFASWVQTFWFCWFTRVAEAAKILVQMLAGSWDQYLAALDIQLREKLVKKYGL